MTTEGNVDTYRHGWKLIMFAFVSLLFPRLWIASALTAGLPHAAHMGNNRHAQAWSTVKHALIHYLNYHRHRDLPKIIAVLQCFRATAADGIFTTQHVTLYPVPQKNNNCIFTSKNMNSNNKKFNNNNNNNNAWIIFVALLVIKCIWLILVALATLSTLNFEEDFCDFLKLQQTTLFI